MPILEIECRTGKVKSSFAKGVVRLRDKVQLFLDKVATLAKEYMREEAPCRTGRLRDSITIFTPSETERVVRPTAEHAVYVHFGTKPSPGRYVPAIGRRLVRGRAGKGKIGTHPGIKPNPFVRRAYERLIEYVDSHLSEILEGL